MTSYMAKDQGNFDFSVHDPFNSDVLLCITGAKEVEVEPLKG